MKEYSTSNIRNIALVSHSSAGKTVLVEAFLHTTGATTRMGSINEGTTVSDFDEEEVRRSISLYSSVIPVEFKDTKINFIDTPGYTDFVGEMISALSVVEGAVIVVDAVSGYEVGTEVAWKNCDKMHLPRFVLINKMDRENADFNKVVTSIEEHSATRLVKVQLPWGEKQDFKGIIDLLSMKAFKAEGKTPEDIPAELQSAAEEAHMTLVEAAAEGDDSLLEKYLESGKLAPEEIIKGLTAIVRKGDFIPVLVSAGEKEIGVLPLLNVMIDIFPSPDQVAGKVADGAAGEETLTAIDSEPLAAYIWKTTADPFVGKQTYFRVFSGMISADSRVWNSSKETEERLGNLYAPRGKENMQVKVIHSGDIGVCPKLTVTATGNTLCDKGHPVKIRIPEYPTSLYQVAIFPKTMADSTKISPTLTRLCEEDMTLSWHQEPATNQTILKGMGDQHIDVAIRRAESKFQVNLETSIPKVPYKETITKKATAMYRHKKQSGGSGQFGEVHLNVEPLEGDAFEFVNAVFGGAISSSYMPAIEKGIRNVMKEGILAGYTVTGIKVEVFDGKEHPVDSKPIAFEIAGREAFKLAFKDASPVLMEPIMLVKVIVPEEHMGDILGDMNTRRARVQGMETEKGQSTVTANVPLSEMQRYTTDLRSITGGRGVFDMEFSHYEVVPAHITNVIVEKKAKEDAEKEE
ncbi:MAG TPA: elongation factor G [Anaerolineaceae bacterium]|jgi:elongation factor G|nr:elongation factor G [Anaerolineaceae bacterium]